HHEYESNTLLLEYRRDIKRFLKGESDLYPSIPDGYFDQTAVDAAIAMRDRAFSGRREELMEDSPIALLSCRLNNTWSATAVSIYRNWLLYLSAQKELRLKARRRQSKPFRHLRLNATKESVARHSRTA